MLYDTVWLDARLATLTLGQSGLGTVERGAVAAKDGRIAFGGASDWLGCAPPRRP